MKSNTLALALATLLAAGAAVQADAAAPARAASAAIVEAVQMPAWVERNGENIPLAPGMALRDSDHVRTGEHSRLLLRMPEGSAVKLGENAGLALDSLRMQRGRFAGAMRVVFGAFRFTTDLLAKAGGVRRELDISVATVTIGVRGTDIWGKSTRERDIVCLIEGRIQVQRGADAEFVMDQPLSYYVAPRRAPAMPVAPVPADQFKEWAAETEIEPGRGAARRGGRWKVVLATVDTQEDALRVYDTLRDAGYAADIDPQKVGEKSIYHIRLSHLPSRAEAQALADSIRGSMGIAEPRVSR